MKKQIDDSFERLGTEIEPTEDEVSLTVQRIKAHNMLRNMTISKKKAN